jgi:tetratricopeptide (TPR) repeat protein
MGNISSRPKDAKTLYGRGIAYLALGKHALAINDFNEVIRLSPQHALAFYNRGLCYQAQEDYEHALSDFSEAIRLTPTDADAFNHRAMIHMARGDNLFAKSDFDEAIRLNPQHALAFHGRGLLSQVQGLHLHAIHDFNKAIGLSPNCAHSFYHRGISYKSRGKTDRALKEFSEAIRLDSSNAEAYYQRAELYYEQGEKERAIEDYKKALKINPKIAARFQVDTLRYFYKNNYQFYQSLKKEVPFRHRFFACGEHEIPDELEELLDPIHFLLMNDPITCFAGGPIYDRETIKQWFVIKGNPEEVSCPFTCRVITKLAFQQAVTHEAIKQRIEAFVSNLEHLGKMPVSQALNINASASEKLKEPSADSPSSTSCSASQQERDLHSRAIIRAMAETRLCQVTAAQGSSPMMHEELEELSM